MKKIALLIISLMFAGIGSLIAELQLDRHIWELGAEISHSS